MTLDEMIAEIRRVLSDELQFQSADMRIRDTNSKMVLVFGNSLVELRVHMSLYSVDSEGWLKVDPAKYSDNLTDLMKRTFTLKLVEVEEEPK